VNAVDVEHEALEGPPDSRRDTVDEPAEPEPPGNAGAPLEHRQCGELEAHSGSELSGSR
jgi:hypothetical protein